MIYATLSFDKHRAHLVDVRLRFRAHCTAPELWLPTWIAGSYLIREFAKNITSLSYVIDNPQARNPKKHATHRAPKLSKNRWQLTAVQAGDEVTVHYEVYCYDLSVRTAYLDQQRLFGNMTSLLMTIDTRQDELVLLTMHVPPEFLQANPNSVLACAIRHREHQHAYGIDYVFEPKSTAKWYDCPFEIGTQDGFEFEVSDAQGNAVLHRFFVAGRHQCDLARLKQDLQAICQTHFNAWGFVPFGHYTFMTLATAQDYGGLEHLDSTALITPRGDLPSYYEKQEPSASYQRFLGLCSHEYFHAWWVKSVRPDVMMSTDLQQEAPTPLLWVFEGFTSYLDNLMLYHAGVIDQASYLQLLADDLTRYYNNPGRHYQTVAESSFDAWIKLYRPDENSPYRTTSYYNKGALVALCLDLLLLRQGHRLYNVVKHFITLAEQDPKRHFGMSNDHLSKLLSTLLGAQAWQDFYHRYIMGVQELPLDELLSEHHIQLQIDDADVKPWGMTVADSPAGLVIKSVHPDSPAATAGLSAKDIIIAIDGLKISNTRLHEIAQVQAHTKQAVLCHVFRRDELLTFNILAKVDDAKPFTQPLKVTLSNPTGVISAWLGQTPCT